MESVEGMREAIRIQIKRSEKGVAAELLHSICYAARRAITSENSRLSVS
jgi:hypothetical protein